MKKNKFNHKITLKIWKSDGKDNQYHSNKTKRIFAKIKAGNFTKSFLKVSYGYAKTNTGRVEEIINSGTYFEKQDLRGALKAFTEKSLLEETETWINESNNSHKALQTDSSRNGE